MPTYVYQVILEDEDEGQVFEIFQKMSDPPLTHHPVTGQPVRRVIQAPNLPSQHTTSKEKHRLSAKNIAEKGFTRYEKGGDGKYIKTAGKGPKEIRADPK